MIYIVIGIIGFLVIHLFDFVALKRMPWAKPIIWALGSGLFTYALVMISLSPDKLLIPTWATWLGWVLLLVSLPLLIFSLFINLPFRKTYIEAGIGDKLIRTGLYALVRHPGVPAFTLFIISTVLVSRSMPLLIASPIWIAVDILLVYIQDRFIFGRMFADYDSYQRETPMLIPNRKSIRACLNSFKQASTQ